MLYVVRLMGVCGSAITLVGMLLLASGPSSAFAQAAEEERPAVGEQGAADGGVSEPEEPGDAPEDDTPAGDLDSAPEGDVAPAPAASASTTTDEPAAPAADEPAPPTTDESTVVGDRPATPGSASPPARPDEEEIVITADRRTSTLQDYPGAVSALSQDALDQAGINSVRDLTAATPYMQLGTQEGNTEIFIRGVGSNNNTELGDPAAAMHFDGIYIPRPRGVGSMLYDVDRVEISRGPQGTLRGRNATAGAINVVTHAPELDEWQASTTLQFGNYMQRLGKAMVNVPVGDDLALRLAAYHETHDPFYTNAGPIDTITPAESADTLSYRASALWVPLSAVKVILRHDYTMEGGTGTAGTNYHPALVANVLPKDIPDPRHVHYRGPQGSLDLDHFGASADVSVDLGPFSIGYLGSYRDLDYEQVVPGTAGVDYPGMEAPNYDEWGATYWHTKSKSFVQELRLYSPDDHIFRWNVGGFLFTEDQKIFLGGNGDNSNGYVGFEYNHPKMKSSSIAGFADLSYDFIDALRAIAGVRYTSESKERHGIGNQYSLNGLADGEAFRFGTEGFRFAGLDRNNFSVPNTPEGRLASFRDGIARFGVRDTLPALLTQPGVTLSDSLAEQHGQYSGSFIDFRLGLDYDVSDDHMLYVMFSTGHQSGGFNDTIADPDTGATIAPEYDPEVLYATEVGSKNKFFDGRLTANVAAFWYQYSNQQFSRVQALGEVTDAGASAGTLLKDNLGTSRILGFEADIIGQLPLGLELRLAGLLLNAEITDAVIADTRLSGDPAMAEPTDLSGNKLPRAPLLSLNYGLRQTFYTPAGRFFWRVGVRTKTKQYMDVFNGDGHNAAGEVVAKLATDVPSYTVMDAGLGYTRPDGMLSLEMIGTNLGDTTYMTTLNNSANHDNRYFNAPRQVALRMTLLM